MKAPQLRFSLFALLVLIGIFAIGLGIWQRHVAWEKAQEEFAEIISNTKPNPEQIEAAERFIRHYPELGLRDGAILFVVKYCTAETCQIVMQAGADTSVRTTLQPSGIAEVTPLHYAAIKRNLPMCEVLLELGASLEETYKGENSALHAAVMGGDPRIVQLMLDHGARRQGNAAGYDPIKLAEFLGDQYDDASPEAQQYDEIVRLLQQQPVPVDSSG